MDSSKSIATVQGKRTSGAIRRLRKKIARHVAEHDVDHGVCLNGGQTKVKIEAETSGLGAIRRRKDPRGQTPPPVRYAALRLDRASEKRYYSKRNDTASGAMQRSKRSKPDGIHGIAPTSRERTRGRKVRFTHQHPSTPLRAATGGKLLKHPQPEHLCTDEQQRIAWDLPRGTTQVQIMCACSGCSRAYIPIHAPLPPRQPPPPPPPTRYPALYSKTCMLPVCDGRLHCAPATTRALLLAKGIPSAWLIYFQTLDPLLLL